MGLENIFNEPFCLDNTDEKNPIYIYPVTLKDYDKFKIYSSILYVSRNHFAESDAPLLYMIFSATENLKMTFDEIAITLCELFIMVTHKKVSFMKDGFYIDGKNVINLNNYEQIREVIMEQNVMIEEKVYKNEIMREWAKIALEQRMKNQPKIGIEDMITTVSTRTGKHYWDLKKYTIYQLYSDYYRVRKDKSYNTAIMARCQGADIEVDDFSESLELYKNPHDDLFVDSNKLNKFEK